MPATLGEVLIWIIIGGLSGSFVGMLATRSKQGFGRFWNLLLGMAGALVGGLLFNVMGLEIGLGDLSISFEDLIAGFTGSVLVLLAVWGINRYRDRSMS